MKSFSLAALTSGVQFLVVRNLLTSGCCQLRLAYIAERLLPPCMTLRPISLIAYMSGIGPEAMPPVRLSVLPAALSLE